MNRENHSAEVAVIGGGLGGYAAALMAADLGLQVALIDSEANPGGVCQYRWCIPYKAVLHIAKVLTESREALQWGIEFCEPTVHRDKVRAWQEGVVEEMAQGLGELCRRRDVHLVQGRARFLDSNTLKIEQSHGEKNDQWSTRFWRLDPACRLFRMNLLKALVFWTREVHWSYVTFREACWWWLRQP